MTRHGLNATLCLCVIQNRRSEYAKFMEQVCTYLKEGKNSHIDAPDSLSLFCRFVESLGFNRVNMRQEGDWVSIPISVDQIRL